MYNNDFSIQEVNAYYDRKGGMRTSNVSNYANVGSFASLMRRAAAQRSTGATPEGATVTQSNAGATSKGAAVTQSNAGTASKGTAAAQTRSSQTGSVAAGTLADSLARAYTYPRTANARGTLSSRQSTAASGTSSTGQGATAAHVHSTNGKNASDSTADAPTAALGNGNVCCEQCHQTNQLMLQMMAKNLYTQSSLGYPLTGLNTWSAYQSMAGMLGNSLFS